MKVISTNYKVLQYTDFRTALRTVGDSDAGCQQSKLLDGFGEGVDRELQPNARCVQGFINNTDVLSPYGVMKTKTV